MNSKKNMVAILLNTFVCATLSINAMNYDHVITKAPPYLAEYAMKGDADGIENYLLFCKQADLKFDINQECCLFVGSIAKGQITILYPLMHIACMQGHVNVIKVLIKYGASINLQYLNDATPLHHATLQGHLDAVNFLLLQDELAIDARTDAKETALFLASIGNFYDIVEALLAAGASHEIPDVQGFLPIHVACENGNLNMVKLLLDHGANINAKNGKFTPLSISVEKGHTEIADYLREQGAQ